MSSSVRRCEFSTTTSGTERERGFGGILPCRSEPLNKIVKNTNRNFVSILTANEQYVILETYCYTKCITNITYCRNTDGRKWENDCYN